MRRAPPTTTSEPAGAPSTGPLTLPSLDPSGMVAAPYGREGKKIGGARFS
jgi:hypothetical protein